MSSKASSRSNSNGQGPESRVYCTYPDCPCYFKNVQDMKNHKTHDVEHDYCRACDEDFEDEERFLIHKIKSDKHITCPVCGVDFRSIGGRDNHIRQTHPTEQHLVCFGCKAVFKKASALMRHIEEDRCPKIDRVVLVQEQSRKYLVKAALKAHEENPLFPLREDADDSEGGGVKLSSLELENREAMMNQPKPVDNKDNDDDNDTNSDAANMHWPKLGDSRKATPNDLTDFNKLSVKDDSENGTDKGKARADSTNPPKGPWNRETPKRNAPGQTKGSFGLDPVPNIGSTLRTLNEKWDPTAFFNSFTGFYDCPCGGSYGNMQEFQEHVLKKTRARRSVQCPGCYKMFKTTSALIAHCESQTARCSINEANVYGQIIDEISGGLIQTGYNEDGTIKYEAGELDLPKRNVIGPDLGNADW